MDKGWLLMCFSYTVPEVESFQERIVEADEKLKEAKDEEAKELAIDTKSSLMWRTLRLAMKDRLRMFDKLENFVQDLRPIYRPDRLDDQPHVNGVEETLESRIEERVEGVGQEDGNVQSHVEPVVEEKQESTMALVDDDTTVQSA